MANEWPSENTEIDLSTINNGKRYRAADGLTYEDLNKIVMALMNKSGSARIEGDTLILP